ncbi:MAG TPA: YDG domain-containing protein [Flavobacterium sp.]
MGKITPSFYQLIVSSWLSRLSNAICFVLIILTGLFSSQNTFSQAQIIGSFPAMNGGFETGIPTVLASATVTTGTQLANWSYSTAAQNTVSLNTTTVRSGAKSLDWTTSSTSGTMITPTPPAAAIAASTSYVIQFYYWKNNASTARAFNAQITADATANLATAVSTGTLGTGAVSTVWTKSTTVISTTAASATGKYGFAQFKPNGGSGVDLLIDDFCVYAGTAVDNTAPNSPGSLTVDSSLGDRNVLTWTQPIKLFGEAVDGVDGGGYVVVRYGSLPNADNDPNQNGIYGVTNTTTNGTSGLTGTVIYTGTASTYTDYSSPPNNFFYKVYAVDKAFNYSNELTGNGVVPVISVSGTLTAVNTTYGTAPGAPTSFFVSGTKISTGILVTPPAGYEVSLSSGSGYASTLTITGSGSIVAIPVYVRLSSTATVGSSYSGNIVLSSVGATSVNVATVLSTVAKKVLTMSGLTVPASKEYDGTTTAVVSGTPSLQAPEAFGSGTSVDGKPYTGEDVSIGGLPIGTYNSKDVLTATTVTYGGLILIGDEASNYTLTIQTSAVATITPKALTVLGAVAQSKPYDGTNAAVIIGTLTGVVGADAVTLNGTGTFESVNIGTGIAVTPTCTLGGGAITANYTLTPLPPPPNLTADITKANQTITLATAASIYANFADYGPATSATAAIIPITYKSSNLLVATIVNNKIHYIGVGITTITASQAGNSNCNAAADVNQILTVMPNLATKKKVLYATLNKTLSMDGAASTPNDDPIIRMLSADPNFNVTVVVVAAADLTGSALPAFSGYDLLIVQESFSGTSAIVQPTGKLAIKNLTKPVIYNKAFALQGGSTRAVSGSSAASDTSFLSVTVTGTASDLYSGIAGTTVPLFKTTSDDSGSASATGKGISYVNGLDLTTTGTLKATVTGITNADKAILINDIPGGTKFGTAPFPTEDICPSRMVAFGFNYGAICESNGKNVTNEFLTIWRNAAYMLTGQMVPTTLYINPDNNQTITFKALPTKITTDANFPLTAASYSLRGPASGLQIAYTGSNDTVATVTSTGLVDVLTPGTTIITASQPGPGNPGDPPYWYAAPAVSQTLTVSDDVTTWYDVTGWDNGTPSATKYAIIAGTYTAAGPFNGDFIAQCLRVDSPNGSLTINAGGTVTVQNEVINNAVVDGIVVGDIFGGSGSLVQVNDAAAANIGDIKYYRETTAITNMDYTYWSSPVAPPFTLGGVSPDTAGDKFYSFDSSIEDWKQESTATVMTPGVGYIIRGPQLPAYMVPAPTSTYLATFTGVPNSGHYQIAGVVANKSYLLGNPYPSALDADEFLSGNVAVLDGTLYFWTHNTAIQPVSNITDGSEGSGTYAYTSNDYASYNLTGGAGTAAALSESNPLVNIPTGKIASGQGFVASSKLPFPSPSPPTTTTIDYYNYMRVGVGPITGDNSQFFKTKNTKAKTAKVIEKHRVWLSLTNTQGLFKEILVGYVTDATNDYDNRFDGESFDGNLFADFYSVNQDKKLVIQGRALPFDENDQVPLGFITTIDGSLTIGIDYLDGLLANQKVFLEDKLTNKLTDLKKGSYTFTTVPGTFDNRFVLRYTHKKSHNDNKPQGVNEASLSENSINIYKSYGVMYVDAADKVITNVKVYNTQGKLLVEQKNVNAATTAIKDLKDTKQVLVVKVTSQEGEVITEKVIN